MKKIIGTPVVIVASFVLIVGTIGCRSGFKMSNPFSKAPSASSAKTPSELDEMDELTPPPENYTKNDPQTKESDSLAQKGKYEVEPSENKVEQTDEALAASGSSDQATKSQDNFAAPDYSRDYQVAEVTPTQQPAANVTGAEPSQTYATIDQSVAQTASAMAPIATQSSLAQPNVAAATLAQQEVTVSQAFPVAQSEPTPASDFPTIQSSFPVATNDFPVASTPTDYPVAQGFPVAQVPAAQPVVEQPLPTAQAAPAFPTASASFPAPADDFPVATNSLAGNVAQVSGATPSNVNAPTAVAMNYDPNVKSVPNAATNASNSDPYSGVYYDTQTVSSGAGFAPGSVSLY